MSKHIKTELIILASALILVGVIIFLTYKLSNANTRADNFEKKYDSVVEFSNKKYKSDSISLVKIFNTELLKRDSSLTYANGKLSAIPKIKNYYDAKIHYTQTVPVTVVNPKFDSLLTELRRYNK